MTGGLAYVLRAEADDVLHRDFVTLVEIRFGGRKLVASDPGRTRLPHGESSRGSLALAKRGFAVDARAACALSGHRGGHRSPISPSSNVVNDFAGAAVRADFTSCVSRLRFL